MAGKPRNVEDTTGMSKTARASALKKGGRTSGFLASGELDRVYSLSGGTYTRILDPRTGRSHHLRVGSPRYDIVVTELLESDHGEKIKGEILGLGFPLPEENFSDS